MYAYKSARCVSQWQPSERKHVEIKLRGEPQTRMEPFSEWKQWAGVIGTGTFQCGDLVVARKQLLASGRSPRVTMRSITELSGLTYKCIESVDQCKGRMVLRESPEHAEAIQTWLKKLGDPIVYLGQRLPGVTLAVLLQLMTCERRTPKATEKEEILKRQHNRCAHCGSAFNDDVEFDHIAALKTLAKGQTQQFQALCSTCHQEKTDLEGGVRSIESRFSHRVWEAYVKSPKPPPLVWQPHADLESTSIELNEMELDVVRCRRNAMAYSAHPWSVFCALDSI